MYERESPEQYVDLKKLWLSYQNRKREVVGQYEAAEWPRRRSKNEELAPSLQS